MIVFRRAKDKWLIWSLVALHYSVEGYKILGKRFAESALKLILK